MLQGQYWVGQGSYRYVPILEFADAFEKSALGRARTEYLAQPFDSTKEFSKDPLVYDTYALSRKLPSVTAGRILSYAASWKSELALSLLKAFDIVMRT